MKVRLVFDSKIPKFFGAYAITLYPFIFFTGHALVPISTIKHELIHIEQIQKLGVLKFYFNYLIFYVKNYLKTKDQLTAYNQIPYESEAYSRQNEPFTQAELEILSGVKL